MAAGSVINKTMDRSDLESDRSREIMDELGGLIRDLRYKQLRTSSWYGCFSLSGDRIRTEAMNRGYRYVPIAGAVDDESFPWFLDWEIVWVVLNADFRAGQRVLDFGGSSSLFSYYLASKGLDVTTIDLQDQLVENADHVARRMGWKLANYVMDMSKIEFTSRFEHVTSICVYEHVPVHQRVRINRSIGRLLVPGGRFSITFDYGNPSRFVRINNPTDIHAQFVRPSGLKLRGNKTFKDNGQRYLLHPFFHPDCPWGYKLRQVVGGHFRPWEILESKSGNDYTFGALFQEKQ